MYIFIYPEHTAILRITSPTTPREGSQWGGGGGKKTGRKERDRGKKTDYILESEGLYVVRNKTEYLEKKDLTVS